MASNELNLLNTLLLSAVEIAVVTARPMVDAIDHERGTMTGENVLAPAKIYNNNPKQTSVC